MSAPVQFAAEFEDVRFRAADVHGHGDHQDFHGFLPL